MESPLQAYDVVGFDTSILVSYTPLEMTKFVVTSLIKDLNDNCEGYEYAEILEFDFEGEHAQKLRDFGSY